LPLAGFFGIGGGVLIVPALVFATRMPILNAISTSLLAVTCLGLTTAVNYALSGLVNWSVAGQFIAGGYFGGFLGIGAGIHLSRYKGALNKIFSALIMAVAAYVLYRSGMALSSRHFARLSAVERPAQPWPATKVEQSEATKPERHLSPSGAMVQVETDSPKSPSSPAVGWRSSTLQDLLH
jgi:hypothetical protein